MLRDVCDNLDGAEQFINEKTEEICSREKLYFEELIYFVYEGWCF